MSPEVFGPGTENFYTLCKVVWFGLDFPNGFLLLFFFFFSLGICFKCLHLKEALSRESLQKYFESPQIQNLMIFLIQQIQVIYPHNILVLGRMPWLDCVTNTFRHVWLAGVAFLEPLSGVSSYSPDWWMSHQNLCFVCGFYQSSSGSRQCDWLTLRQVSGKRSWSEVTQVTAEE